MQRFELTRPVFLIGFMGAGKTTLARKLARRCGLAAVDTDRSIERETGMRISELYPSIGDEAFRELEADTLLRYCNGYPLLIACGGGIVCGDRSRQIIKERGFAIHMVVSADESASRISNHATRPHFESMDSICSVNEQRMPLYCGLADATVNTRDKSSAQLVREVQSLLEKEGILCPLPK